MWFWVLTIGVALSGLVAGLLSLSMFHPYLRRVFPKMTDKQIQWVRTVFIFGAVFLGLANAFRGKATIAELENRLRRPSLAAEQQSAFVKKLNGSPKEKVHIQCGMESAWPFCRQIASLFKNAGWNFEVYPVGFGAPPQGVMIVARSITNPAAIALQEAFKLIRFPLAYFGEAPPLEILYAISRTPPGDEIWLIIGDKS